MLKLSKMTDYAVVILADMAQNTNKHSSMSASMIAQNTKLPEPTVSKILKLLSKHDLIASSRGANGGYTLNRDPQEINMKHVVAATDGPVALTACVDESTQCCDMAETCTIKGQWNPVNAAMQNALESVSLKQMMGVRNV